jgi:hypothetical protein
MKISKNWLLVAGVVASAVVLVGTRVLADNAWDIESFVSTNVGSATPVTYDGSNDGGNNMAIIDAITSRPKTVAGRTFTSWSIVANDASGAILIYSSTSALNSMGYTSPAVGDQISVTGNWAPYHGIPELSTPYTVFTKLSSGNATIGAKATTIPTVLANAGIGNADSSYGNAHPDNGQNNFPLSQTLAGYIVEIPDVVVSGLGTYVNFPNASLAFTITDNSANSMTLYFWPSSYSSSADMIGAPIPTWPVDVYGFLSSYPSKLAASLGGTNLWQDEITPIAFVGSIPEPSSFMLAGMGLLSLIAVMRRRRS